MHTVIIPDRFVVPALVAATFHVVLLFGVDPTTPEVVLRPPGGKTLLRPFPPAWIEPVTPPPEEKAAEPVQALNPGPARPETEDRSVPTNAPVDVTAPPVTDQQRVPISTTDIPKRWGDGTPGEIVGAPDIGTGPVLSTYLDRTPRATFQIAPDYPLALRQAGIEGSVTVEFDVDRSGQVVSARVLHSTVRDFEAAALRAVRKWRFEPGKKNGQTVPFRMSVPISFAITPD